MKIQQTRKPILVSLDAGGNCNVYYDRLIHMASGQSVLLTGTSRRISSDHYGQFHEGKQRERVAREIANVLGDMGL
jgi:hypothetical protein